VPEIADSLLLALILSAIAGLAIPLGGYLARVEHIHPAWLETELRHSVIAFGGGALFSAVALVLVPHGVAALPTAPAVLLMGAGGVVFAVIDGLLDRKGGQAGQLLAMLLDFVPESLALGALLATGSDTAYVLAVIIFLQNVPEAFNAFRELQAVGKMSARRVLRLFWMFALLGPAAACVGNLALAEADAVLGAVLMLASGGILYLVFEDIAPQAELANRKAPPLGAVAGFMLGLTGHLMLG
jgi:ZIP family zinc transporter